MSNLAKTFDVEFPFFFPANIVLRDLFRLHFKNGGFYTEKVFWVKRKDNLITAA